MQVWHGLAGTIKVLDFGLAKLVDAATADDVETRLETDPGTARDDPRFAAVVRRVMGT